MADDGLSADTNLLGLHRVQGIVCPRNFRYAKTVDPMMYVCPFGWLARTADL